MSQTNIVSKIAIVGITGRIGKAFAEALLKTGKHQITALVRPETTGPLPSGLKSVQINYDDEQSLVSALKGQQFLIITLSVRAAPDVHSKLVKAAIAAGVPRIMPNVYGGDIFNVEMAKEDIYAGQSLAKCEEIKQLGGTYIAMCCGFWYSWSLILGEPWFGFDIKNRAVTFFDDGKAKISSSTWEQCGRAIAALLSLPESGASPSVSDWDNKPFYFDSFVISQRDMLDSLHKTLGTTDADWKISHENSKQRYEDGLREMSQGQMTGFAKALYTRRFYPDGSGQFKPEQLTNDVLGLPKENLDKATKEAVELMESGWNPFA